MKKLTIQEKKIIKVGAASAMGIATGILTFSSIANLIMDLIHRYWKKSTIEYSNPHENCFNSDNGECFLSQIDLQRNLNDFQERNRITFF